jgi:hypothetical protein
VVIVLIAVSGILYMYKHGSDKSPSDLSNLDIVGNENVSLSGIDEIHGGVIINGQPSAINKPASPVVFNDIPRLDLKLKMIRFPSDNEVFRARLISDKWKIDHEIDVPRNARVQDVISEVVSKLQLSEYVAINVPGETNSQWILKINGEEVGPDVTLESKERFPPGSVLQLFLRWQTIVHYHPTSKRTTSKGLSDTVLVVPPVQTQVVSHDDVPL